MVEFALILVLVAVVAMTAITVTGNQLLLTFQDIQEAVANPGDPFLRNMAVALSLHSWNNTAQDWLRLEAALVILHHKPRRTRR